METILITGGSGLIGTYLAKLLVEENYKIIHLSRTPSKYKATNNIRFAYWNYQTDEIEKNTIEEADYIIHLAGENISKKRWTKSQKKELAKSRIESSNLIFKTLKEIPNKVKAVISASGINFYGGNPNNILKFNELAPKGEGFLADICEKWEENIKQLTTIDKRVVIMRTGVVMSSKAGALKEFLKPMKFRIIPLLGNKKQKVSWVHIEDIARAYIYAIKNKSVEGIYNITAPNTISYHEDIIKIAKIKYRNMFISIKIPDFLLKFFMGKMAKETILTSIITDSAKITKTGFEFLFPKFDKDCINNLLSKSK